MYPHYVSVHPLAFVNESSLVLSKDSCSSLLFERTPGKGMLCFKEKEKYVY
jgi:hypothetical protein